MQGRLENDLKLHKPFEELTKSMPSFAIEWLNYLKSSDLSLSSCYDYGRKIRNFLEYITPNIKDMTVDDITFEACESYFIACQTRIDNNGMEIITCNSYRQSLWSVLNNFFKFLVKNGYIEYNYMDNIERTKSNDLKKLDEKRVRLTQKDFNKILSAAKQGTDFKNGLLNNRDVLIILLFLTTGIRKSAVSEIDLDDINITERTLSVVDTKRNVITYNLSEQIMDYLDKWLEDRKQLETSQSGNALFLKRNGTRLGDDSIYNIVKRCCKNGIGKDLSPNQLRSGFCSFLYNKTHDIEFVRKVAGQKNIQTAERYVKKRGGERKKATEIISNILNQ